VLPTLWSVLQPHTWVFSLKLYYKEVWWSLKKHFTDTTPSPPPFDLRNFKLHKLKKIKKIIKFLKTVPDCALQEFEDYRNESVMRERWQKNIAGRQYRWLGGHVAADQLPTCWSMDFNWTLLCVICSWQLYVGNWDLRKLKTSAGSSGTQLLRSVGSVCIVSRTRLNNNRFMDAFSVWTVEADGISPSFRVQIWRCISPVINIYQGTGNWYI
jgi:hypothetical protein